MKPKKQVVRHLGFNMLYDVIQPQLKKRFNTRNQPENLTELNPRHFLFVVKIGKQKYIFKAIQYNIKPVGLYPEGIAWDTLVNLEKHGNLCPESLLCLVQNIPFDTENRLIDD